MSIRILSFLALLLTFQLDAQNKFHFVSIERTSCFGKCPAYKLVVSRNGEVVYEGKRDSKFKGTYPCKVSPKKVISIFQKYQGQKLAPLKLSYIDKVRDNSKLHVDIDYGKAIKSIRNAQAGPVFLQKLANDLDSLISDKTLSWSELATMENGIIGVDESIRKVSNEFEVVKEDDMVFEFVEQMAEFPGGESEMMKFLGSHIHYPPQAVEKSIRGKVILSFVIDKDGSINAVKVVKGLGLGCDEEAVRVVKSMPKWKPGRQNGMVVRVQYTLPVLFQLED